MTVPWLTFSSGTLRSLINAAERSLTALAERDDLLEATRSPGPTPGPTPAPELQTRFADDVRGRDFAAPTK